MWFMIFLMFSWSCYVRGPMNEDLSYLIKSVKFFLHDSFPNPVQEIFTPPYEIHEQGWGEFEIKIELNFIDSSERCVEVYHRLKLFHSLESGKFGSEEPVVSEYYELVMFQNPSPSFRGVLVANPQSSLRPRLSYGAEDRDQMMEQMEIAHEKVLQDIYSAVESYYKTNQEIVRLQKEIESKLVGET
eukprot:TRINITY_DN3910_c0_g1_i2.p1 TRINITY_DN3910_c0_g1~~TRINITY_DN3910_c0_g1_i2.p1  ORF type:complete len:187 (-),score=28.53 TRINITY_DN3910_c0_g1_i2:14-574(-)